MTIMSAEMATRPSRGLLRIGALSERTGISPELLRAWERRYGLLEPERSEGGFRLYRPEDEARVEAMKAHLETGLAASEAARLAIEEGAPEPPVFEEEEPASPMLEELSGVLLEALERYDEPTAQEVVDRLLADLRVETVLRDAILPVLRRLGERWESGEVSIAQEHFASGVLRGRLMGLARGWGAGDGPRAILACAPTELHDLSLLAFGIALSRRGWRITYLGPDTPIPMVERTVRSLEPQLAAVLGSTPEVLRDSAGDLRRLGGLVPLIVAGPGATAEFAREIGANFEAGDPVSVAGRLSLRSFAR